MPLFILINFECECFSIFICSRNSVDPANAKAFKCTIRGNFIDIFQSEEIEGGIYSHKENEIIIIQFNSWFLNCSEKAFDF